MNLILLRHGQSEWNIENRFTGWTDVDLTDEGRRQAAKAGKLIADAGLQPRAAFTSVLRRAIHTLDIVLDTMQLDWIPVVKDWHLNERHYGALQGLDKAVTSERFGAGQVASWRRGWEEMPPLLTTDDLRWPGHDPRYSDLAASEIPLGESLRDAAARARCCWEERIEPALRVSGTVIVAAHGNSLRGLAFNALGLTAADAASLEIPTASPWLITFDESLKATDSRYLQ